LAVFLSLGGCSRNNITQAKPISASLPYPTTDEAVEQEAQVKFEPAMVGFAEGKAQEGPKDIIAAQIRSQDYACNSTQSAERVTGPIPGQTRRGQSHASKKMAPRQIHCAGQGFLFSDG
jgi:hypothetical protein